MHDANGKPLKVGDVVLIPARVTETYAADDYCNVQLQYVKPFYPDLNRFDKTTLNSKMVYRANVDGDDEDCDLIREIFPRAE